jgi:thiamine-monophosphate kinase
VTGPLGGSAAGLALLRREGEARRADEAQPAPAAWRQELVRAHQRPAPQVAAGRLLVRTGLGRALNDVSDGVASEAAEIAAASGVGLAVEEALLPRPEGLDAAAAEAGADPLDWMLYGGEDYQLLGTAKKKHIPALRAAFEKEGLPFHIVGYATDAFEGVRLLRPDGTAVPLEKRGYNHFRED